jgi:hypothetical protein
MPEAHKTGEIVEESGSAAVPGDPAGVLLAVMRRNLGVEDVGPDSGFYALGGDSLIAVRVVNEARSLGVPIGLRDLMVHQTVRAMLGSPSVREALDAVQTPYDADGDEEAFGLLGEEDRTKLPTGVVDALPASSLQIGMLYLCETSGDAALYTSIDGWEVRAPFDETRFRTALKRLAQRHQVLRSSFEFGSLSVPAQLVWKDVQPELTLARATTAEEAEQRVRSWCESRLAAPFDWREPSLASCHVVVLPKSFHVVLAVHHAILDGWSMSRLTVELMALYEAERSGKDLRLAPVPASVHRDFILAEHAAEVSGAAADHWFVQADIAPLLFADAGPVGAPDASERRTVILEPPLVEALTGVARTLGVSLKSVALAAHVRALAAWTGRERDIVTGVVFNTRPQSPGADLAAGLFLNTLPVRFPDTTGTWTALVKAATEAEAEAAPHHAFPQARVVERLGRPAFDVAFNYMRFHAYQELDALAAAPAYNRWRRGKPSFPMHVNVEIDDDGGEVRIGFDPSLLAPEKVDGYADLLRRALASLAANPVSPSVLAGERSAS